MLVQRTDHSISISSYAITLKAQFTLHWNFSLKTALTPPKVPFKTRLLFEQYCSKCISSRRKKRKEMALPSITVDSGRNDGSLVLPKPCRFVLQPAVPLLVAEPVTILLFFFKHPSSLHCCKPHLQFQHFFYGNVCSAPPF